LTFIENILKLDEKNEYHLARILILLSSFGGKKGIKPINGITKLVKLDFLLRYPLYFEKAIKKCGSEDDPLILDYEKYSVESKMVRYLYGPWDPRYRQFINILIGKGLVKIIYEKNRIDILLTDKGKSISEKLLNEENFFDLKYRSEILYRCFNFMSATQIKNFIYDTFPEIKSLEYWEEIQ